MTRRAWPATARVHASQGSGDGERGSAVADFAMVGALLCVLFMAAFQLGLALHVRNTMIESVAEGARYGARADASPSDGAGRARDLITSSISARYADDVTAERGTVGGVEVVTVTAHAPLPILGFLGPSGNLTATAHAFAEQQ